MKSTEVKLHWDTVRIMDSAGQENIKIKNMDLLLMMWNCHKKQKTQYWIALQTVIYLLKFLKHWFPASNTWKLNMKEVFCHLQLFITRLTQLQPQYQHKKRNIWVKSFTTNYHKLPQITTPTKNTEPTIPDTHATHLPYCDNFSFTTNYHKLQHLPQIPHLPHLP